ncbi:MAG: DNA polymerase I [Cryomorphaceae bacterium]|nr:DNA polymerase I [Cryomorphaceae bacterium]
MADNNNKLFLLDAYALIFRSYFAFARNPRISSKGLDTSAIFGFTTTLMDLMKREKPSHLAVVFDVEGPTSRHETFEAYKANRNETPEGIKIAVPFIKKLLEAMNIPIMFSQGYEADDVIGTLAYQASDEGFIVYMMTPDKDFGQLIRPGKVYMYKPARGGGAPEVMSEKEVCEKWNIQRIDQVIDMLGLMGDAVDNIPGIPGVGEKTAAKLLAEYDTLEGVLENADKIKGKLGEKIRANKEQALLSKQLATILTDAPVKFNHTDFHLDEPDMEKVKSLFEELEFRTLWRRFAETFVNGGDDAVKIEDKPKSSSAIPDLFSNTEESAKTDLTSVDHFYQCIDDEAGIKELTKVLNNNPSVCFDTETTSLVSIDAKLIGIAFSYEKGKAYYVPFRGSEADKKARLELLRPFFESDKVEKIAHNLKYDMAILKNYDLRVNGPFFDTMIAHYVYRPDGRHSMDIVSQDLLGYTPKSIESLIGKKGKNQGSMEHVPLADLVEYAGEDADITFQLSEVLKQKLKENELESVFHNVDIPLVEVLCDMERNGVHIDVKALAELSKELEKTISETELKIIEIAGEKFNVASPAQLGVILFEKLKLVSKPKKTKTGQYSTGEEVLSELAGEHEIVRLVLEFRQLSKLKSTYVDSLPKLINKQTKRIHTSFNQAVAATGRLSSTNPNLQNIPIRTEKGRLVRKAFVASSEDTVILAADYSQIELRLMAEMSGDTSMRDAFAAGLDIHAATAANIFNVDLSGVSREQRGQAKTVNFGIIYGVSAFGLSQQTNLSRSEAAELIKSYFETYPGIRSYMDKQVELAREKGYVTTLLGRKRALPDINSRNPVVRGHAERNAVNTPIQGSAADIIKLAMARIHKSMDEKGLKSRFILQVHDELVFEAYKDELETLKTLVKDCMENAYSTSVKLEVDLGEGGSWLEAH